MMVDWLLAPIDPARPHEIGVVLSWHARSMVIAWGIIVPACIFVARYLKIMPWQNWPLELDNKIWWRTHWFGMLMAYVLTLVGLYFVVALHISYETASEYWSWSHAILGYFVILLATLQVLSGLFRGSKGGPTSPKADGSFAGDHYDMTPLRIVFEIVHRSIGYLTLLLGVLAILSGLWEVNAPRWMWIALLFYWLALGLLATYMQFTGRAFDTYQAIWGADPDLAGNRMKKMGWGTVRPSDTIPNSKEGTK